MHDRLGRACCRVHLCVCVRVTRPGAERGTAHLHAVVLADGAAQRRDDLLAQAAVVLQRFLQRQRRQRSRPRKRREEERRAGRGGGASRSGRRKWRARGARGQQSGRSGQRGCLHGPPPPLWAAQERKGREWERRRGRKARGEPHLEQFVFGHHLASHVVREKAWLERGRRKREGEIESSTREVAVKERER